jgi:hypothetical protein
VLLVSLGSLPQESRVHLRCGFSIGSSSITRPPSRCILHLIFLECNSPSIPIRVIYEELVLVRWRKPLPDSMASHPNWKRPKDPS